MSCAARLFRLFSRHYIGDTIPVYRGIHHRANLTRTFKTEYQPPTDGTTEQEILKTGSLLFLCPDAGQALPTKAPVAEPNRLTAGGKKSRCRAKTLQRDFIY